MARYCFLSILANLLIVRYVEAQDLSSLPACIQNCVASEISLAASFNCAATDIACLCDNANFGNGIVDCSTESCPSGTDINAAVTYLSGYCANAADGTVPSQSSQSTSSSSTSSPASSATSAHIFTTVITTETASWPNSAGSVIAQTTFTYTNFITDSAVYQSLVQGTSAASSSSSSTTSVSPSPPPQSGGLSTGAKAGIGVGVSLGVIAVVLLACFILWRRRRAQRKIAAARHDETGPVKPELHNRDLPRTHGRSELNEKRAPVELDAQQHRREQEERNAQGELSGSQAQNAESQPNELGVKTMTTTSTTSASES